MEIVEATAPSDIDIALSFEKPWKSENSTAFRLQPDATGATTVTWTMIGQHTTMSKLMGIVMSMDKLVGKDFEKGLAKLKAVCEAPPS